MKYEEFYKDLNKNIKIESVLKNPKTGESIIIDIDENKIRYRRGKQAINISIKDIYDIYVYFYGRSCSTNDLKEYKPYVFNSKAKGHDSHCTFLFMILKNMGLISEIKGGGNKNDPFYIEVLNK